MGWGDPKTIEEFDPQTGMAVDRILEAESALANQQPAGLGLANAIQLSFGAAQFGPTDPVQIDANGLVTFNEGGFRRIKLVLQIGRTGASGTSVLFFRLLVNGVQIGRSLSNKLSNADDERYIEVDNWFNVPPGATLSVECMRDNAGSNFGGVFRDEPTDEGAGTWNAAPCCLLRVERWEAA